MGITFVKDSDIFSTQAQTIAVGVNAAGRSEVSTLFTALADRYPVFISDYRKRGRAGKLKPGDIWLWREGQPWILAMVVRDTPQGATRPRYVEAACLKLAREWTREGLKSLALLRLAEGPDWPPVREIVEQYLGHMPVTIYED